MTGLIPRENFDLTVGTRLRALRMSKNVSFAEMAAALGKSEMQMARIENGTSTATAYELHTAAALLGVTTSVVIGEIPATTKEGSADE